MADIYKFSRGVSRTRIPHGTNSPISVDETLSVGEIICQLALGLIFIVVVTFLVDTALVAMIAIEPRYPFYGLE
jgi:hypothetical protein